MGSRAWKLGICVLVAVVILLIPRPAGLTPAAWHLFAMYLAAIFGLVLRPFPEAVILLSVIAISGLAFGNMGALLSGYASTERLARLFRLHDRRRIHGHRPRPARGLYFDREVRPDDAPAGLRRRGDRPGHQPGDAVQHGPDGRDRLPDLPKHRRCPGLHARSDLAAESAPT